MCTDISRGHSKYIDGDGDLVCDPYSHTITRRICQSLIKPSEKINTINNRKYVRWNICKSTYIKWNSKRY